MKGLAVATAVSIAALAASVLADARAADARAPAIACFRAAHVTATKNGSAEIDVDFGTNSIEAWHTLTHADALKLFEIAKRNARAYGKPISLSKVRGNWVWTWQSAPKPRLVALVSRCLA